MNKLTKVEAVKQFKESYKEFIQEMKSKKDITALNTQWHMFTDGLCKDGLISQRQYENWMTPKF
jgi:hypothetical protein